MKINMFNSFAILIVILTTGCHNEPYEGDIIIENNACALAIEATNDAALSYVLATPNTLNILCEVYINALENQIEVCGDENGALQSIVTELDNCSINNTLCEDAIAATQVAQTSYNAATDTNFEDLCNAYKDALQNQINSCGPSTTLQAIFEDLGTCEPEFVDTAGTWRLVSWLNNRPLDIDNDGTATNDYLEEIDCYTNETIIFNVNGSGTFFYRSIAEITYTPITGSATDVNFNVVCNEINLNETFSWTQNGNTIPIVYADGSIRNHFRNGNSIFVVIQNGFLATNTEDSSEVIAESVTYVYEKI